MDTETHKQIMSVIKEVLDGWVIKTSSNVIINPMQLSNAEMNELIWRWNTLEQPYKTFEEYAEAVRNNRELLNGG